MRPRTRTACLTSIKLHRRLHYSPETGVFTWLPKPEADRFAKAWNVRYAGTIAGAINKESGYRQIAIDGTIYLAQQLAWLYIYGEWPPEELNHKNKVWGDNRIDNLRPATRLQNLHYASRKKSNKQGIKGVGYLRRDKLYRAQIRVSGKDRTLGVFKTKEAAQSAYNAAAHRYFGEFAWVDPLATK